MKLIFNMNYFLWFLLLFATETAIALFLKTGFIRHTFGDYLVVILLYCLLKSFWKARPITVGIIVLVIAYVIEFLQLFNFLEHINLSHSMTAKIIFGNTFLISDLFAYTLGISTILLIEHQLKIHRSNKKICALNDSK